MIRDRIWHPYTRESARPETGWPVIVRGEGIHLFDENGDRYVDAISSWWACALGHSNPRLTSAIARQSAILQHSILGNLSHPPALHLAEALCALMPTPDRRVHFASDGSSAVEAALKIAIQYGANRGRPERRRLVSLEGAYHGDTLGAMTVGDQPSFHAAFREMLFHSCPIPVPSSPDQEDECLRRARDAISAHAGELAAMIVEPMCQGAAGMRMYSARFLSALADVCRTHGLLLIADEIAMGFGRTGRMFAFEHAGLDPDLVCVGKAISGGMLPLSAVIVRDAIADTFTGGHPDRMFAHGHTFAGNPVACAVALEALRIYREERMAERTARLGDRLREALSVLRSHEDVKEVRTLGLIGAVEFRDTPYTSGAVRAGQVRDALLRLGVLARPLGAVIYLMPPLTIREDELDALTQALIAAVMPSGPAGAPAG